MAALKGDPMTWWSAFVWVAADWTAWAVVAPFPLWLARTWPIGREHLLRSAALYAMGFLLTLTIHAGVYLAFDRALGIAWRPDDPFITLDTEGVGELMRISVEKGKVARPEISLGVCGEHGGDPASIEFCENIGLSYVSCSPFRVPIARVAAAQASLRRTKKYWR